MVAVLIDIGLMIRAAGRWSVGKSARAPYRVGQEFTSAHIPYDTGESALVVFARGSCLACRSSAGLLSSLVDTIRERRCRRLFLVTGRDSEDASDRSFRESIGHSASQVLTLADLKVLTAPTLVLVDRTGRVEALWEGRLDASAEKDILTRACR